MYRSCTFCSAALGGNEAIERFPVGRSVAFDAWKGRLWAVCPRCTRWNLAPIEERWEAVEEAERHFVDARIKAHSENIGVARLPDRTRLIRVGRAEPRELAAWRYADPWVRRRWRRWFGTGAAVAGGAALLVGGVPLMAGAALPIVATGWGLHLAGNWLLVRSQMRPILRVADGGREVVLRLGHAHYARLVDGGAGHGVAVAIPSPAPPRREVSGKVVRWVPPAPLVLRDAQAGRFLERTLVSANAWGLTGPRVRSAADRLTAAGEPGALLQEMGRTGAGLFPPWMANKSYGDFDPGGGFRRFVGTFRGERIQARPLNAPTRSLPRVEALALEMALQEAAEQRALAGELAALEAAWREAEEIAAIADALPGEPPDPSS